jgi:hypothetical protein
LGDQRESIGKPALSWGRAAMNARAGAVKRYKHTKYKRGTSEGKEARATRSACGDVRG